MKKIILLLPFIFIACGGEQVADLCESSIFETSGLIICSNYLDVNLDELDRAVEILEEEVALRYYNISNLPDKFEENEVKVVFTDKLMSYKCKEDSNYSNVYTCENHISGVTIDINLVYVVHSDCLARTAFIHELLHVVEGLYLDTKNTDHQTSHFFTEGADPAKNAIEVTAGLRLKRELKRCQN